jgi:hypothetical protein
VLALIKSDFRKKIKIVMQIRQWYYGKHEITQNGRMGIRLPYKTN